MLMRKEVKMFCNLYNINEREFKGIDYSILDLEVLNRVLSESVYRNHMMLTKEDYTLIDKITDEEYYNLRYFNVENLFISDDKLTLDEYKAKRIIENMIIPKIYIKYAEIYTEDVYNNMIDRLYN